MAGCITILEKLESLRSVLRGYESCLVAYSGGVDSVLLAVVARQELGDRMLAAIADSASLPRAELAEARELAGRYDFPLELIATREFENSDYTTNPANRCFFCKQELFKHLEPLARARGLAVIAYGENTSDLGDYRPGAEAARQFAVCAPLTDAGLTKANVREASRLLGLPTADKPQMPCLSSRVPYGEEVTRAKLVMIEQAEGLLRGMGFREVRVRHHESGPRARVEVGADELARLEGETWALVKASLGEIGYATVEREARGYARGRLNAALE